MSVPAQILQTATYPLTLRIMFSMLGSVAVEVIVWSPLSTGLSGVVERFRLPRWFEGVAERLATLPASNPFILVDLDEFVKCKDVWSQVRELCSHGPNINPAVTSRRIKRLSVLRLCHQGCC